MKFVVLFIGIVSSLISFDADSQPVRVKKGVSDSLILAISPITWSFNFLCYPKKINDTPSVYFEFAGSRYLSSYDSDYVGDTITRGPGPSFELRSGYGYFGDLGWDVRIKFDTIAHELSISYGENRSSNGPDAGGFAVNSIPYTIVGPHIMAAVRSDTAQYCCPPGHECNDVINGVVTIGGGTLPSKVSRDKESSTTPSIVQLFDCHVIFLLNEALTNIRIFDLLGHECDRITIPAGAESVELNTSRLAPGLYVARLGHETVKFIVP